LVGLSDEEMLRIASGAGRVLVTHGRKTMPERLGDITTEESVGVLIVPQNLELSTAIEELILVWIAFEAEEGKNVIFAIPFTSPRLPAKSAAASMFAC
jgi:hypothetical protein